MPPYELPELPYSHDALEPHIDQRIMELHHDAHHQGYVNGANAAVESLREMRETDEFGDVKPVERSLSFNLSGHINHSIFWKNMHPDGGGEPSGALADQISEDFGSLEQFKAQFNAAASGVEGSGWGLLVHDPITNGLQIIQAENHNNRAIQGSTPLLVVDVWEHAYYLQYENNRGDYLDAFWNVVNWDDVAQRFQHCEGTQIDWM